MLLRLELITKYETFLFFPLLSLDCYCYWLHKRISYREVFEIISVRKKKRICLMRIYPLIWLVVLTWYLSLSRDQSEEAPSLGLRRLDCSEGGEDEEEEKGSACFNYRSEPSKESVPAYSCRLVWKLITLSKFHWKNKTGEPPVDDM